jgi:hypothetical protein
MRLTHLFTAALLVLCAPALRAQGDTIRLEVGSPRVDGRVYKPHAARVLVRVGEPNSPVLREWTNELTIGDSAGRKVMHWVTKGKNAANAATWELRQTYDLISLKPLGYNMAQSIGSYTRVSIDGDRVRGVRRPPGAPAEETVDVTLDRPGFFAGASDLVPAAVGFKAGAVMIAPVWNPTMTKAEPRIFTVVREEDVNVEGKTMKAWRVEERRMDKSLYATWWLLDKSPYMVYGEVILPDGRIQRMSEVEIGKP